MHPVYQKNFKSRFVKACSHTKTVLLASLLFAMTISSRADIPGKLKMNVSGKENFFPISEFDRHYPTPLDEPADSTKKEYVDPRGQKNGITPWITPAVLISGGTALHFMPDIKASVRDFAASNFSWHSRMDDYLQYAPIAAVYGLTIAGIPGKNNFGNKTALAVKSFIINGFITDRLKIWINEERPNGGIHSFPSGHTSKAFSFAHVLHKEYGAVSPWISVGAYTCAATVGFMRVAKSAHWVSDVFMGAGIGILSTELVYRTHQYKWDNEHLKRFDIFPFQTGKHRGLALVYTF